MVNLVLEGVFQSAGLKGQVRFGILAGPHWVGQIIPLMQIPHPTPPAAGSQSSVGGLGAGHSCFPFLLNHTAAIWTRLTLPSSSAGPQRASPDGPGPQSPGPCLLLQWLILSVPALCRRRPSEAESLQVVDEAYVGMLLCVYCLFCHHSVNTRVPVLCRQMPL